MTNFNTSNFSSSSANSDYYHKNNLVQVNEDPLWQSDLWDKDYEEKITTIVLTILKYPRVALSKSLSVPKRFFVLICHSEPTSAAVDLMVHLATQYRKPTSSLPVSTCENIEDFQNWTRQFMEISDEATLNKISLLFNNSDSENFNDNINKCLLKLEKHATKLPTNHQNARKAEQYLKTYLPLILDSIRNDHYDAEESGNYICVSDRTAPVDVKTPVRIEFEIFSHYSKRKSSTSVSVYRAKKFFRFLDHQQIKSMAEKLVQDVKNQIPDLTIAYDELNISLDESSVNSQPYNSGSHKRKTYK